MFFQELKKKSFCFRNIVRFHVFPYKIPFNSWTSSFVNTLKIWFSKVQLTNPYVYKNEFKIFFIWFAERRKLSSGADTVLSRTSHKSQKAPKSNISRKLEMEFSKAFFGSERRRIKSNDQKEITSSSSEGSSDAEHDSHLDIVFNQSRRDLENTQALKIRRHLLHSEDYVSIFEIRSELRKFGSVI